jgi:hypothetical protein
MQDDSSLLVLESRVDAGGNSIVRYLAEIETPNTSESRAFYLALDGEGGGDPNQLITLVRNYSSLEYATMCGSYAPTNFQLEEATNQHLRVLRGIFTRIDSNYNKTRIAR